MKKILISLGFAITSFFSLAQQVQLEETPANWPIMLSNLNQSQIQAGFLYNKSAMFANLNNFNIGDYNTANADYFAQAINELHYAADQNLFVSSKQLKTNITNTALNAVDIGIINTTITTLNFDEKDPSLGGLTFPVDRFVPIPGKPSFLNRKILVAAPLKEMMSGTAVTYNFTNSLIFNNATTAIKNLVVYFNDDVPVNVIRNGVLALPTKTVNYATTGTKLLRFVATFTDDSTIGTNGFHYFTYIANKALSRIASAPVTTSFVSGCNYGLKDRKEFKSLIGFQGYDEPTEYLGKFDETIFYHTTNPNGSVNTTERRIIKPIIILDGFDPGDKRKTTDCDCEQDVSVDGCLQQNSIKSLKINHLRIEYAFNPLSYESLYDLMDYSETNSSGELTRPNLIVKLRDLGYDVIVLNIPKYSTSAVGSSLENKQIDGGADFLERNGRPFYQLV